MKSKQDDVYKALSTADIASAQSVLISIVAVIWFDKY